MLKPLSSVMTSYLAKTSVRVTVFAACLDGSFDERRAVMPVDRLTARMVALARSAGAAANSAGSGGAIVGIASEESWARVREELSGMGASAMRPRTGG